MMQPRRVLTNVLGRSNRQPKRRHPIGQPQGNFLGVWLSKRHNRLWVNDQYHKKLRTPFVHQFVLNIRQRKSKRRLVGIHRKLYSSPSQRYCPTKGQSNFIPILAQLTHLAIYGRQKSIRISIEVGLCHIAECVGSRQIAPKQVVFGDFHPIHPVNRPMFRVWSRHVENYSV